MKKNNKKANRVSLATVKNALKGATHEIAIDTLSVMGGVAVGATTNALVHAGAAGVDTIYDKIVPQTVTVKRHRFSKEKTMTEQEFINELRKGKKFVAGRSNRLSATDGYRKTLNTAGTVAGAVTGTATGFYTRDNLRGRDIIYIDLPMQDDHVIDDETLNK